MGAILVNAVAGMLKGRQSCPGLMTSIGAELHGLGVDVTNRPHAPSLKLPAPILCNSAKSCWMRRSSSGLT
jgi:hypothetical protein